MWHSLGKVTVAAAGTPVIATTNETTPTDRYSCQTLFIQQMQANTGKLWICDRATANKTTGVGILAVIPAPSLNASSVATTLPYASVTIPNAPGAMQANKIWIDADNTGESAIVSALRP